MLSDNCSDKVIYLCCTKSLRLMRVCDTMLREELVVCVLQHCSCRGNYSRVL